ncbi:MAG: hypothetical protein QM621_05595, partial [Aeromicrobium sp.]
LDRAPRDLRARADRLARDWQARATERIRTAVADRRLSTDVLALGVPGLTVSLLVLALGGENAESGRIGKRVLDAVLTRPVVTALAADVAGDLRTRVAALVAEEEARFAALTPAPSAVRAMQDDLREAARKAEHARHVDGLESRILQGSQAKDSEGGVR